MAALFPIGKGIMATTFSFNGVRVTKALCDEHLSRYIIRYDRLADVHVTVDWSVFPPELRTSDVLDHAIDRALRASKQWRLWHEVYCGSA